MARRREAAEPEFVYTPEMEARTREMIAERLAKEDTEAVFRRYLETLLAAALRRHRKLKEEGRVATEGCGVHGGDASQGGGTNSEAASRGAGAGQVGAVLRRNGQGDAEEDQ